MPAVNALAKVVEELKKEIKVLKRRLDAAGIP